MHSFDIFHFCRTQLLCTYDLSKLPKWTCYIINILNRSPKTFNILKLYRRMKSYAVHFCTKKRRTSSHAHTFLLHFRFFKIVFLCLQAVLNVVLACFYPKHASQKPKNPYFTKNNQAYELVRRALLTRAILTCIRVWGGV